MKVAITLAMSNTKAVAEQVVTSHLPEVLDNLCKIHLFRLYKSSITEWGDELEDKHLYKISDVASNVKTKKGHLAKDVLHKLWLDEMTEEHVARRLISLQRSLSYKKLKQSTTALTDFVRGLRALSSVFAIAVLDNSISSIQGLRRVLVDVALTES